MHVNVPPMPFYTSREGKAYKSLWLRSALGAPWKTSEALWAASTCTFGNSPIDRRKQQDVFPYKSLVEKSSNQASNELGKEDKGVENKTLPFWGVG